VLGVLARARDEYPHDQTSATARSPALRCR
jgi:hypothetical protein